MSCTSRSAILGFRCFGIRVGLRADTAGGVEMISHCLPPGARPSGSAAVDVLYSLHSARPDEEEHRLYRGDELVARAPDLGTLREVVEATLERYVAENAPGWVFVHAGVVGWRGRAIVAPGRSFAGKSTLTAALLRAGASYYSDEYAVVDRQGRIHPYPRPLSLRESPAAPPRRCPVEALHGRRGKRPLSAGLVVVTEYKKGARWRPRVVPAGQALLALLANTVCARTRPQEALAALRPIAEEATTLKGPRGEADEMAARLLERAAGGAWGSG